jgi:hypothetical protein
MNDHPETGEQAWSAADRDQAADQREDIAGARDTEAAVRDLVADEREQLADAREAELDERERRLADPDLASITAAGPSRDEQDRAGLSREDARQVRELDGTDRDVAATARDRASQQRLAATPTAGTPMAGTPATGPDGSPSGPVERDERTWTADKRDFVADERDSIADSRDAIADARDVLADERDQRADAREAELDEREQRLAARGPVPGPGPESNDSNGSNAAARDHARQLCDEAGQDRDRRRVARDGAAVARDQSGLQRQAATPATGLAMAFAEIAQHLYEAGSVDEVLTRIAETCVAAVPSCRMASITVRHEADGYRTVASTDRAATEADQAQYDASEGPCLTALGEAIVYTPEFPDPRWPTLGSHPAGAGVHSVVSFGLAASGFPTSGLPAAGLPASGSLAGDPLTGSLNAYATEAHAFDDAAREIGLILAAHASVALRTVGERESLEQLGHQLHAALSSRDVIGQAKGILMERLRITPDDAFDLLRRSSQRLNVKLREIAQKLTETGELDGPDRP